MKRIALIFIIFWALFLNSFAQKTSALSDSAETWNLTSFDIKERFRPYLSNGYQGVKISGEGTNYIDEQNHFVAGVWLRDSKTKITETTGRGEKICAVPRWLGLGYHNGDEFFSRKNGRIYEYKQVQNMKEGYIRTLCTWIPEFSPYKKSPGKVTDIDITVFLSRDDVHIGAVKYQIKPNFTGPVSFIAPLQGNNLAYSGYFDNMESNLKELGRGYNNDSRSFWLETETSLGVKTGNAIAAHIEGVEQAEWKVKDTLLNMTTSVTFQAEAGKTYTFYLYSAVFTSHDSPSPVSSAREKVLEAAGKGWDSLFDAHKEKWKSLWQTDILIEGDNVKREQKQIRSVLFNLLQSFPEDGAWVGLGPSCLSDGYYHGGMFWDADWWTWTPVSFLHSELARPLLEYRFERRKAAAQNAAANGCTGYKWPWTSGYTGLDMCEEDFLGQIHVGGWVALAQWNYYLLTKDQEWLRERGWPVLKGTCDYWISRAVWNPGQKRYEFKDVVPPLEQGIKDNCTITAVLAWRNLNDAIRAAEILGISPDPQWKRVAGQIYLPYDSKNKRYLQYEGYNGHHIDQSSASMMIFPVEYPVTEEEKANMVNYYTNLLNPNQPVVAYATFGVIFSEMKQKEKAWQMFRKHHERGCRGPFEIWVERSDRPDWNYFMQSSGSYLHHVVFGFAGVRLRADGIYLNPSLPSGWTRMRLTHICLGDGIYDFELMKDAPPKVVLRAGKGGYPFFGPDGKKIIIETNKGVMQE